MGDAEDWQRKLADARDKRKNHLLSASRDHMTRMLEELSRWHEENAEIESTYLDETEGLE